MLEVTRSNRIWDMYYPSIKKKKKKKKKHLFFAKSTKQNE